jgi:hypothetical protein
MYVASPPGLVDQMVLDVVDFYGRPNPEGLPTGLIELGLRSRSHPTRAMKSAQSIGGLKETAITQTASCQSADTLCRSVSPMTWVHTTCSTSAIGDVHKLLEATAEMDHLPLGRRCPPIAWDRFDKTTSHFRTAAGVSRFSI